MPGIVSNAALAAMLLAGAPTNPDPTAAAIARAAHLLLPDLECGRRIDAVLLRAAMERAFGRSDAEGSSARGLSGSPTMHGRPAGQPDRERPRRVIDKAIESHFDRMAWHRAVTSRPAENQEQIRQEVW